MLSESGSRDDQEFLLPEARDGEVGFDPAAFVEALGVDDRAGGRVNLVGADVVEERERARAAHFEFVERGLVEQARVLARHQVFVADGA